MLKMSRNGFFRGGPEPWRTYNFYWYIVVGCPLFLIKTGKAAHDLLTKNP